MHATQIWVLCLFKICKSTLKGFCTDFHVSKSTKQHNGLRGGINIVADVIINVTVNANWGDHNL